MQTDTILLAQLNPIVGDIEYNYNKAVDYLNCAKAQGIKFVVYPELFLLGYPPIDLIERYPLIVEENIIYLEKFAKQCVGTSALIGFCEFNKSDRGKKYYNSVAFIQDGVIKKIIRKSLLPVYSEFSEARYFEAAPFVSSQRIVEFNDCRVGVVICEESWNDDTFFKKPMYSFDPVEILVKEQKPDFIINLSASPTRAKKEQLLNNMLSHCAKKYSTPILYVNQTGSTDCITFCGASRAYGSNGELIARAKSYEEDFFAIVPYKSKKNRIEPLPNGVEKTLNSQKEFTLDYDWDLERTYLTITNAIKDYFEKNGFKRAVLGLSGGLDSSCCAYLLACALGPKNVLGVSMPSKITSAQSKSDAKELANNLGINFFEIPIKDMVDASLSTFNKLFDEIQTKWGDYRYKEPLTFDNIQARSRAMILWGVSNEFSSTIPIATSDKSELYMGYATINGDMSGGFAPVCDVTKTKLFALARWMNNNALIKNAIPEAVLIKPPGAELAINPKTGKPLLAEEALMPYEFLDEVIWRLENLQQKAQEMLKEKFLYEKTHKLSFENKKMWLDKFAKRVQFAQFKWSIMPPGPIVDSRSIVRAEYIQPIASKLKF